MNRTILVVKHVLHEGPGLIEPFFRNDGWDLRTVELGMGEKLPDTIHGFSAV